MGSITINEITVAILSIDNSAKPEVKLSRPSLPMFYPLIIPAQSDYNARIQTISSGINAAKPSSYQQPTHRYGYGGEGYPEACLWTL